MIKDVLGKRLKEYRINAGLTIFQVGERLGKSGKTVSAWENCRSQPDADTLFALCKLYGISSISELLAEETAPAIPAEPPRSVLVNELLEIFESLPIEGQTRILGYAERLLDEQEKRPRGR